MEIVFNDGTKKTLYNVKGFSVIKETTFKELNEYEVSSIPVEGKLFEINPLTINRDLFEKPRKVYWQERVREIIKEAFVEVDKNPEKYAQSLYTLIPEKNWNAFRTVEELIEYADYLGGYIADKTEQALEWAQRISNGETWESICDNSDTANCLRLVAWENNYYRLIGDSGNWKNKKPPTRIGSSCKIDTRLSSTVPLVAFKKKFPF